tara:strand:- start:1045 stop:1257 length:213 start_codon:yes stop_codon:yes gene_type:complete
MESALIDIPLLAGPTLERYGDIVSLRVVVAFREALNGGNNGIGRDGTVTIASSLLDAGDASWKGLSGWDS